MTDIPKHPTLAPLNTHDIAEFVEVADKYARELAAITETDPYAWTLPPDRSFIDDFDPEWRTRFVTGFSLQTRYADGHGDWIPVGWTPAENVDVTWGTPQTMTIESRGSVDLELMELLTGVGLIPLHDRSVPAKGTE